MTLRKLLFFVLGVLALSAAIAYLFRVPLSLEFAKRVAASKLAMNALNDLPDGLHVGICGAGSPFPDDKRAGACTLVVAGKRLFVFDAGSASVRNIGKMGFSHGNIDAVFLTHFHSDHIDGLGELLLQRWVSTGNTAPVTVYGPPGVQLVVSGLMQAYGQDQHYRVAHHGDATVSASGFGARPMPFGFGADGRSVVWKDADLEITAFAVDHAPVHPAVGYLLRYKGRSLVLSGDTKKSAAVQREAQGVDLLIHEALSPTMIGVLSEGAVAAGRPKLVKIFSDIMDYHATPEQAAETARDARVKYLLLNHITPALPFSVLEKAFLGQAPDIFAGPIRIGSDGDFVSLPAGSTEISVARRF